MMTQTKDPSTPDSITTDIAMETMALDTLTTALANVSAVAETFQTPVRSSLHNDQIDFHQAELAKLRRDSDTVVASRTGISNHIAAARADLKRIYEAADKQLKDREKQNADLKVQELADIKKSMQAHSAALHVLSPGSTDNVETFRAPGSAKVS